MASDLRKYPRYFLPSGLSASFGGDDAHVVDLSVTGARLQVRKPLAVGATVAFAVKASGGMICVTSSVRWCQIAALSLDENSSDVFLAGIAFDGVVAPIGGLLSQLIARGDAIAMIEGRKTDRYYITTPLHGTYGTSPAVRIIDLSVRGARISSAGPIEAGTRSSLRFQLSTGTTVSVRATVVWCSLSEFNDGYDIGLSIEGEEALMRAVIAQLSMQKAARVASSSLQRKFDPLQSRQRQGALALAS